MQARVFTPMTASGRYEMLLNGDRPRWHYIFRISISFGDGDILYDGQFELDMRAWNDFTLIPVKKRIDESTFVKPHMALAGQTPAQAAGIEVEERNKWLKDVLEGLRGESGVTKASIRASSATRA